MTATHAQLGDFNAPAIASSAATAAGSAAAAAGVMSTAWIPVIGPAVAAVTLGLMALFNRKSGKQKIAATEIVNELEPFMQKNRDAYFEGPRTRSSQAQALKNFDDAWAWLQSAQACGNPELDDAGRRCISERAQGGKWSWFSYYRDPIANDAQVQPDSAVSLVSDLIPGATPDQTRVLLAAGLVVLALAL